MADKGEVKQTDKTQAASSDIQSVIAAAKQVGPWDLELREVEQKAQGAEHRPAPPAGPPRFILKPFNEIGLNTSPPYLVKGLVPREGPAP